MAYDQLIRRVATGQGTVPVSLGIGSTADVTVTFDVALADLNYVVAANVFTATSSLLNQLAVVGCFSKTTSSCVIRVKNTGVTITASTAAIDVIAVRRVTS